MSDSIRPRIDYTGKDYESMRLAMLDLAKEKLPEWTDRSPNDFGVVLVELFAYMGDMLMYYQDRIANEGYLDTAAEPRSIANLLRLIGYKIRPVRPATAGLILTYQLKDTPTETNIDLKMVFKAKSSQSGKSIDFRYLGPPIKFVLPAKQAKDGNTTYKFPIDQGTIQVVQVDQWIEKEIIGSSNGTPCQRFKLREKPVIAETVKLKVGSVLWQQYPTLLASHSLDKHYTLEQDENDQTFIVFGDNLFGQIPEIGKDNLCVEYCIGGGVKGNVLADTILQCDVPAGGSYIKPEKVTNPEKASGGTEHELFLEAAKNGPKVYRSLGRAVTAEDYVSLARQFGVAKARARDASSNTLIELFVAPEGGGYPTDAFIHDVYSYFEQRRMLTTRLAVRGPQYVPVEIAGTLEIEPYFPTSQVLLRLQEAVNHLLAFDQVDFECVLYLSKFYEAAEAVEGVKGITITSFQTKSNNGLSVGKLSFEWDEIPIAANPEGIKFTKVTGGRDDR